jgi:hypothetical protein
MFVEGDEIYIKKYFGDELRVDKSKIYEITEVIYRRKDRTMVVLDYKTFYVIEEEGIEYAEKFNMYGCLCSCIQ